MMQEKTAISAGEKVHLARNISRPRTDDYIQALFTDFFEQKGDHCLGEDNSIVGGIARYHGIPVSIVGQRRGHSLEDNVKFNFGMSQPAGYRKALRIMQQADKFGRAIITFIDTPGAYPGMEAEEHGQAGAIANNLAEMSRFSVPIISVVIGEGNSGGALAIGEANSILMLENAVYSILSPEGFATILWKDAGRRDEACELMHLTAADLYEAGVADAVIPESEGGAQCNPEEVFRNLDKVMFDTLQSLRKMKPDEIIAQRYQKYRTLGIQKLCQA